MSRTLYPLFLDLAAKAVVVVGGGPVGAHKALALAECGAVVTVIAPHAVAEIVVAAAAGRLRWLARPFADADLDGAFLAVAATGDGAVNAAVAAAASARRLFVNAVDDPGHASAFAAALVRRGPITVAFSSGGRAPAVCRLLRELLDTVLPDDDEIEHWTARAEALRVRWRQAGVPITERYQALVRDLARRQGAQS